MLNQLTPNIMFHKALVFFVSILTLTPSFGSGKINYEQGWIAFNKNDRAEARKQFELAAQDTDFRSDALFSLCLINGDEEKEDAAFDAFKQAYEASVNPYPFLYAFSSQSFLRNNNNWLNPKKLAFMQSIIADPKINGTLKAIFRESLGAHYEFVKDFATSKQMYDLIGAIKDWQVLGGFDNTSGSGFNKDWGAVSKANTTDTFTCETGAKVTWFTPAFNKPNYWFAFDYHFALNDIVMYAQTYVKSPLEQKVFLRVGTSGSLKIWINDALMMSIPEERNCDMDLYACAVTLKPGYNRVLVQIGQSEIDDANFMLRFTDEQANPIAGLSNTSIKQDYQKADELQLPDHIPFFAERFFEQKIVNEPANPLNQYLLGEVYLRNDKAYEATKLLKNLQQSVPNSTHLSSRLTEAYFRANNQTDRNKELQKVKLNDPNSLNALQLLYNEALESEKFSEAETITLKTRELYGEIPSTDEWVIQNYSNLKKYKELVDYSKMLVAKYPQQVQYMRLNYNIVKNSDARKAQKIAEDFCKTYFDEEAIGLLATHYEESSQIGKAMDLYRYRISKMPYTYGYMNKLMVKLYNQDKYKEALAVSDQMLNQTPYQSSNYSSRGYIFKNLRDLERSKESFRKAIYYNPAEYDARAQLRMLENKKEMLEFFPKIVLNELISKAGNSKNFPESNALIVLDDNQLIVYPEGAKEYRFEMAIKILNKSGIEDWKEYRIGYNSGTEKLIIDKAEVLKSDGNVVKAETDDDNYVVFTNLEVNDVLHLEYRLQNFSTGPLSKHFFKNYSFEYSLPSIKTRFAILTPKDMEFNYLVKNGDLKPEISEVEDLKLHVWQRDQVDCIKDEPYASSQNDFTERLYYSSIPNWKFISNWYKDITHNKLQSDYVLKETISGILKGAENASDLEKAKLFYEYILTNISYSDVSFLHGNFIPQKASRTITTKLGDCKDVSTLFVAMCKEVGINSNLVLISTRNYGNHTMPLPAIDFNHCIAQLNVDGKTYYMELTDKELPFASALSDDLHSEILPIPLNGEPIGDQLLVLEMPQRKLNTNTEYIQLSMDGNTLKVNSKSVFMAAKASEVRHSFKGISPEEQVKSITQAITGIYNAQIKLSDFTVENLDNLCDSVLMTFNYDLNNSVQDLAGMKILKLPWGISSKSMELVSAETRVQNLELWKFMDTDVTESILTFRLPKGLKFASLPANVALKCANAAYTLNYELKNPGLLIVHRIMRRLTDEVTPDQYEAFRKFIIGTNENDNKQYAIQ